MGSENAVTTLADLEEYSNTLHYGEQGTGKTTATAAMAKLGPIWFINAEGGLKKRPLIKMGVPLDNITIKTAKTYDDADKLYWEAKDAVDKGDIIGLVFDSYTEIQKSFVENIVETRVAKQEARGMEGDLFFTDRDDYGRMTEQLRRLTRRFRDLPCHVAFTALQKRETESDGVVFLPALTPAFTNDMMGYVDMVLCHVVAEGSDGQPEYLAVSKPVGKYKGKDRDGVLPTVLANPTFDRLVALVNDELDLGADEYQIRYTERMAAEAAARAAKQADKPAA